MTQTRNHWERIHSESAPDEVIWYQTKPSVSLKLIGATEVTKSQAIIDVGGGSSRLADCLLADGYEDLNVLDISKAALEHSKNRLKEHTRKVAWVEADVTAYRPNKRFNLWHDRAVFHFLTNKADQEAYLSTLKTALLPGGHFIIGTFAQGGPKQCSGLEIVQHSPESLTQIFGADFELIETATEAHLTPWGSRQDFLYCRFLSKVFPT